MTPDTDLVPGEKLSGQEAQNHERQNDATLTDSERAVYRALFASQPGDETWRNDPNVQTFLHEHPENVHVVEFLQWARAGCQKGRKEEKS